MSDPTPNLFEYTDFKEYLVDYFALKKATSSKFSHQNFANKAGFGSKSFVLSVIKGRRKLSRNAIPKLISALELSQTEGVFFENLICYNQAENLKEKDYYFRNLNSVNPRTAEAGRARKLREDEFEYFSQWYHAAIRSVIGTFGFSGDYKWLSSSLNPSITQAKAKASVALQERLGFIIKDKDGNFRLTDHFVTTGPTVDHHAVPLYHIQNAKLAAEAIQKLPKSQRNTTGLVLGMSKKNYENVCDIIQKCQNEIMALVAEDPNPEVVYQVNFHMFPVTKQGLKGVQL